MYIGIREQFLGSEPRGFLPLDTVHPGQADAVRKEYRKRFLTLDAAYQGQADAVLKECNLRETLLLAKRAPVIALRIASRRSSATCRPAAAGSFPRGLARGSCE